MATMRKQRGTIHLPTMEGWHVERVAIFGDSCIKDRNKVVIADAIPLENIAAQIVREHNAHSTLIEVVLKMIEKLDNPKRILALPPFDAELLRQAQAALTLAKGELIDAR